MDLNKLYKVINEALEINEDDQQSRYVGDMIQCVIKVEDIGNGYYKYLGMIEDNSNYASEYDMEVEYEDADLGRTTIQYILAYHNDGDDKHFYDENGDSLELDFTEEEEFEQALKDKNESPDNTVIPDKENLE